MLFDDLTPFLQAADDAGDLVRIDSEVSPQYELSFLAGEIARQRPRGECPVVFFDRVAGSPWPVVTHLLGRPERFLRALRAHSFDEVLQRVAPWSRQSSGGDWAETLALSPDRQRLAPRVIRRGAVQQVVKLQRELSLAEVPALQQSPEETGPSFTSGILVLQNQSTVWTGAVPLEITSENTLRVHWSPGDPGHAIWNRAAQRCEQLSAAVVFGGDPLLRYLATSPLPTHWDVWTVAGWIREEPLNLIRCRTVELDVPADAEVVMEGFIDPVPDPVSGALLSLGGALRAVAQPARLQLTAMTHRARPLFPVLIRTQGYDEEHTTALLTESALTVWIRASIPWVRELRLPFWADGQRALIAQGAPPDAREARRLMHALQGLPGASAVRLLIAVSDDVNPRDDAQVWSAATRGNILSAAGDDAPLWIDATNVDAASPSPPSERARTVLAELGLSLPENTVPASNPTLTSRLGAEGTRFQPPVAGSPR